MSEADRKELSFWSIGLFSRVRKGAVSGRTWHQVGIWADVRSTFERLENKAYQGQWRIGEPTGVSFVLPDYSGTASTIDYVKSGDLQFDVGESLKLEHHYIATSDRTQESPIETLEVDLLSIGTGPNAYAVNSFGAHADFRIVDPSLTVQFMPGPFTNLNKVPGAATETLLAGLDTPGGAARNAVAVRVTVTPAEDLPATATVHLRSFDVDDPSTDAVIDPNGTAGADNLGTSTNPSGAFIGTSGSNRAEIPIGRFGWGTASFETTLQPGDNFRIAASLDVDEVNNLSETSANQVHYSETDEALPYDDFIGDLSPTLTVWRRLWIEFDSMPNTSILNTHTNTIQTAYPHNGIVRFELISPRPTDLGNNEFD